MAICPYRYSYIASSQRFATPNACDAQAGQTASAQFLCSGTALSLTQNDAGAAASIPILDSFYSSPLLPTS